MSTERLTPESLEKTIAASERIIFNSPIGLSGRSISSTALKPTTSLNTLVELGAIWGDFTLASGDKLISVTWSEAKDGTDGRYVANLKVDDQQFGFELKMPKEGAEDKIEIGSLHEVTIYSIDPSA